MLVEMEKFDAPMRKYDRGCTNGSSVTWITPLREMYFAGSTLILIFGVDNNRVRQSFAVRYELDGTICLHIQAQDDGDIAFGEWKNNPYKMAVQFWDKAGG
ncbi:MAG: hypothetical protein IPN95_31055 [Bacteroidetes bacterium]|nr:hypothetical protein [Bacteroidota bacterium]